MCCADPSVMNPFIASFVSWFESLYRFTIWIDTVAPHSIGLTEPASLMQFKACVLRRWYVCQSNTTDRWWTLMNYVILVFMRQSTKMVRLVEILDRLCHSGCLYNCAKPSSYSCPLACQTPISCVRSYCFTVCCERTCCQKLTYITTCLCACWQSRT